MRTTLNLDDDLIAKASKHTGIQQKTQLIHMGLQELIRRKAAESLIAMGGTSKKAWAAPRQRVSE